MTGVNSFPLHTIETAPAVSKSYLIAAKDRLGFVPNLYAYMAETPAGLEALSQLANIFSRTTFSEAQRHLLLLTASVENRCTFCVAAHTFGATAGRVEAGTIAAIRSGGPVENAQDAALVAFVRCMIRERGFMPESELQAFLNAGFTPRHALEAIVGVTLKILTNYVNHMTHTELNPELRLHAWEPSAGPSP
jgi:AhpD family alkylhydroperoxidase